MRRLALCVFLSLPTVAAAQSACPTTATLQLLLKNKLEDGTFRNFSGLEQQEFFSRVSCCDNKVFGVEVQLLNPPASIPSLTVEFWVGPTCNDTSNLADRNARCTRLDQTHTLGEFRGKITNIEIPASTLMSPKVAGCPDVSGSNVVWALIDTDGDSKPECTWQTAAIPFDMRPPPGVIDPSIAGLEDAVQVKWTVPADVADVQSYQVLCAFADDFSPVMDSPSDPEYRVSTNACPITTTADAGPGEIDAGPSAIDAGAGKPDEATMAMFEALDPAFICSGRLGSSGDNARIDVPGILNDAGVAIRNRAIVAKVVSVDLARNFSVVDVPGSATPALVTDGWEAYENLGGKAEGGFCFVATAVYGNYDHPFVKVLRTFRDDTLARFGAGRAFIDWYYAHSPPWADWIRAHDGARVVAQLLLFPIVVVVWLWNAFGLWLLFVPALVWVIRKRRHKLAAALALLLFSRGASAQPVWVDADTGAGRPRVSRFAFELKVGLYHPDVDGEPGLTDRPYERVWGTNKIIMPQMELDWFPFHFWGQLGLALSIGYTQQTANSFAQLPNGQPDFNTRTADKTGFHLFPASLSIVYRFTELADRTYVPIVPYVKLGLSYYTWWITKGDSSFSRTASGGKALGGTPGWQATVGLSVRVDALDPEASKNMSQEMGIDHIGLFFELTDAEVSGLWQENRLHVGDFFWSAGVNFEF